MCDEMCKKKNKIKKNLLHTKKNYTDGQTV